MKMVHAVSFPKSGRTWIQLMVSRIISQLANIPIEDYLAVAGKGKYYNRSTSEKKLPLSVTNFLYSITKKETLFQEIPFVFFSHGIEKNKIYLGQEFPEDIYKGEKIFLLVRDPRDVVLSHYYHTRYQTQVHDMSLAEFIRYDHSKGETTVKSPQFGIWSLINYLNGWYHHSSIFQSIYYAYYEDFQKNTFQELKNVSEYIGLMASDQIIQEAVEYGHIDNMRKLEKENKLNWELLPGSKDPRGAKVRKGVIGGYKEDLTESDIEYINKALIENLDPFYSRYIYS